MPFVRVFEWAEVQEELVGVVGPELESLSAGGGEFRSVAAKPWEKPKRILQIEGALVMEIVAHEPITDRRLW